MTKKKTLDKYESENLKQIRCLNSILEEGSEALPPMQHLEADEGTHFLPQPSPNKKPPSKVASQKGYIEYMKRTSLSSTLNPGGQYINSKVAQTTQRFNTMKKKLSAADYLKPTSMTALIKIPSIDQEEVDNMLPTPNKSMKKENIVKSKQSKQYLHINANLKESDDLINKSAQDIGFKVASELKPGEKSQRVIGSGTSTNNLQGKSATNMSNSNTIAGSNFKKFTSQKMKANASRTSSQLNHPQSQNKPKILGIFQEKQIRRPQVISPLHIGLRREQMSPKNNFFSNNTSPVKRLNSEKAMFGQKHFEFPQESKGEVANFTLIPVEDGNINTVQQQESQQTQQTFQGKDQSMSDNSEHPHTSFTKPFSETEDDNVKRNKTQNVENLYKLIKNFNTDGGQKSQIKDLEIKIDLHDDEQEQSDQISVMKLNIDHSKTITSGNNSLLSEQQSIQSMKDPNATHESDIFKQLPKVNSTKVIDSLQLPNKELKDSKFDNWFKVKRDSNMSSQGSHQGSNYKRFGKTEIKPSQGDFADSECNSPANHGLSKSGSPCVGQGNSAFSHKVGSSPNPKFAQEQLKKEKQKAQMYKRQVVELTDENQKLREMLNFILQSKLTDL